MEERLHQFVALVESGSFTAAARQLYISQPALSIAIGKLERELQVILLHRGQKPLAPTEAGWLVYEHAKNQARQTRQLRDSLASHSGAKPVLRIGLIDSLAELLCQEATALDILEASYQLSLTINSSGSLQSMVERGELDYAIIVGSDQAAIGYEPMIHVQATGYQGSRFISYNHGSTTYKLIAEVFAEVHLPLHPDVYSTSPEAMLRLVELGRGSAILPFSTVQASLQAGDLVSITLGASPLIRRPVQVVAKQHHSSQTMLGSWFSKALAEMEWQAHRSLFSSN